VVKSSFGFFEGPYPASGSPPPERVAAQRSFHFAEVGPTEPLVNSWERLKERSDLWNEC
jgi:hypothetical protein